MSQRPRFGKVFCSDWLHSIADQVTSAEFHALFMISRHADEMIGTTKVSAAEIGRLCGLSKQYVQELMQSLAAKGLLGREGGGKGPGKAAVLSLQADPNEVTAFHDDLRDRRAERRAAWKPDAEKLVRRLVSDVGRDVAAQLCDSFEGDDDVATAVLMKIWPWPKKARVAYIEEILERRRAL